MSNDKGIVVKWFGRRYGDALVRETQSAIRRCAETVRKATQKNLSVSGQDLATDAGLNRVKSPKANLRIGKTKVHGLTRHNTGGSIGSLRYVYWNSYEKRWTTASTPPNPPHKQTGHLRKSIGVQYAPDGLSARVGPRDKLKYGRIQELGGTAGKAKLPPRPYLYPAFSSNVPLMQQIMLHALERAKNVL